MGRNTPALIANSELFIKPCVDCTAKGWQPFKGGSSGASEVALADYVANFAGILERWLDINIRVVYESNLANHAGSLVDLLGRVSVVFAYP